MTGIDLPGFPPASCQKRRNERSYYFVKYEEMANNVIHGELLGCHLVADPKQKVLARIRSGRKWLLKSVCYLAVSASTLHNIISISHRATIGRASWIAMLMAGLPTVYFSITAFLDAFFLAYGVWQLRSLSLEGRQQKEATSTYLWKCVFIVLVPPRIREPIEGDLFELYLRTYKHKGRRSANRYMRCELIALLWTMLLQRMGM